MTEIDWKQRALAAESSLTQERADAERILETLLDVTNALADSVSNTHPYAKIVHQARKVMRDAAIDQARSAK